MTDRVIEGKKFVLSYSTEAELLLMATGINKEEFEEHFLTNIEIGSRTILEFALERQKQKVKEGKEDG